MQKTRWFRARSFRAGFLALAASVGITVPTAAGAQGDDALTYFGTRTVTHVGVVVRDVAKAADAWTDVFDVEISPITDRAHTRVAKVHFEGMLIELEQPKVGPSPWRDFLERYGEGIHHLAFDVARLDDHVELLESKGGTRVLGEAGGEHAMVDLMAGFGLYFELTETSMPPPLGTPGPPPTKGMKTPARIGLMLGDSDPFRERYMDLFDVPVDPAVESAGRRLQFPRDFTGDPDASNREIYVPLDNWWVNLIQPVGGRSPWRDLYDKREGAHYFNFNVEDVEETTAYLESKGGHRTLGNETAGYAYVDMPSLGVTILLLTAN